MAEVTPQHWRSLERVSPALFLTAGGLIVVHAAFRGLEAFTAVNPPVDVFGPAGYLLALLGLFGLYPALLARKPRLARIAAGVTVIPLAGWVIIVAWIVATAAGALPPQEEVLPGIFYVVHLAAVILSYSLFGAASLGTDAQPRSFTLLLFVPAVLFVGMIAGAALIGNSPYGAFAIGSGLALHHLALGSVLRTAVRTDDDATVGDVTIG